MDGPAIDAGRVISDLRELDRRTGGAGGARRLCWGEEWRNARELLGELLAELGVEPERDEAGNLWAYLEGESEPALAMGSHIDSVPAGGWLDGAYGVMGALGVLRAWGESGRRPPRTLVLVDWADEEGARFGRSLFGSSACAGTLVLDEVRGLRDADGEALPEVLAANGVDLDRVLDSGSRRERLGGYLELHIEQGPVLERAGISTAPVRGCAGVERHSFRIAGQASHAGTTPMEMRRDAGLAAADAALRIEAIAREHEGVATTGVLRLEPGIPTAVAGAAELVADLRHADATALEQMLTEARAVLVDASTARDCDLAEKLIWRIEPIPFDTALVDAAMQACADAGGSADPLTSGALHDAAEMARVLPAAMVFCSSANGLSHAKEEDTPEADLAAGIEAFGGLANRALASG